MPRPKCISLSNTAQFVIYVLGCLDIHYMELHCMEKEYTDILIYCAKRNGPWYAAFSIYSPTVTKTTYIFKNSLYGNRISQCLRLRLFQLYFKERLALFQARGGFFALQKCNRGSHHYITKKSNKPTIQTLEVLAVYPWQHRCQSKFVLKYWISIQRIISDAL